MSLANECLDALQRANITHDNLDTWNTQEAIDIIQRYLDAAVSEGKPMQVHNLKTWPEEFDPLWEGRKHHEFRKNDRDFQIGDELVLHEWEPETGEYTNRSVRAKITHISPGGKWGIPESHCAMSISKTYDHQG